MFKQRLMTALILIPCVLWLLYSGCDWLFAGTLLVLLVAMGWEWLALIPLTSRCSQILWLMILVLLLWPVYHALSFFLVLDLCLWFLVLWAVLSFPASQRWWGSRPVLTVVGVLCLTVLISTLWTMLHRHQVVHQIVYVLCLVWATDTGAYLVGKRWGVHRLIPSVSPGKTWEGALGGFLLAAVIIVLGLFFFQPLNRWCWIGASVGTIFMAMLGDLFVSLLKRRSKVKDTGHLLPGHGGVLDRLDSLLSALPFFFFSCVFFGC